MSEPFSTQIDKALFEAARGLEDAALRSAFLEKACGSDEARRAKLDRWLALSGEADEFFTQATLVWSDTGADVTRALAMMTERVDAGGGDAGDAEGSQIGRYRLVERIGEGGWGVVYLAEQLEPVRRRVALKVIRLGLDTEHVIARFEMERQALALMDHPNIAGVLDAGATDRGRPYFVMELVSGVKITAHCDEQRLGLKQRLELFVQVCNAIQHAHQKGVIHRDIKPSNILVTSRDGMAAPKVIDFGIARATEGRLSEHTALTGGNPLLGTPAYMSPEQAEGGQDLDTRGDVYSLGVLLVELLTGRTPFDGGRLEKAGPLEMLRILRDEEAPAPSALLAALAPDKLAEVAALRGQEPNRFVAALRGDLDGIALKALAKDRRRRYETVNGLAMDVRRYLDDEPVSARAPGRLYLLGKMIRRHKALFGAATMTLLVSVAGFGITSWQYSRERQARRDAEAARANEARLLQQSKARESVSMAAMLLAEGKTEEADALLLKTPLSSIEPSLEAARVFRSLGDWNAIRQRWRQAADCYVLFLQANRLEKSAKPQGDPMVWASVGPALVQAGYFAEYERFRDEVISRSGTQTNAVDAGILLKGCLLMPAEEPLLARLRPMSGGMSAALADPNPPEWLNIYQSAFVALSLAMEAFRREDFAGALEWSGKCLAYPNANQARAATAHAVGAMAFHGLGQMEQARVELARARAIFTGPFNQDAFYPRGEGNGLWQDWGIARVMVREAADLIEGKPAR